MKKLLLGPSRLRDLPRFTVPAGRIFLPRNHESNFPTHPVFVLSTTLALETRFNLSEMEALECAILMARGNAKTERRQERADNRWWMSNAPGRRTRLGIQRIMVCAANSKKPSQWLGYCCLVDGV